MQLRARVKRTGVLGAMVAAMTVTALAGPAGAVAPRSPAGPAPSDVYSMSVFGSGPIRGIVLVQSGAPGRVRYALQGLPATGELRVVASKQPCGQAHTGAAKVLGWSLGASNPTSAATAQFMVEISGVNAGFIRSVRVFRGVGSGDQRACSTTTHWQEEGTQTAAPLVNVMVTSYVKSPTRGGMILTGTRSDGKVQVRASLTGLRGGTAYRIVGSTAPCGTAHTGSKRVYSVPFTTLGDTATHEVGHWVSAVTDADRATSALRSIRVIKNPGSGNQTEACHGIIAVLIGL